MVPQWVSGRENSARAARHDKADLNSKVSKPSPKTARAIVVTSCSSGRRYQHHLLLPGRLDSLAIGDCGLPQPRPIIGVESGVD
jgi:hypothetical protein